MASPSETGHAKNVTNFEKLVTNIVAFGAGYNPSRENLKLPALEELHVKAKDSVNAEFSAKSLYSVAVDEQELAFKPLGPLVTRVKNAMKASDTTTQVDESAETIFRKLQGKRASAKLTDEEKKALEAEGKEVNQISVSKMSYDSLMTNFEEMVSLLWNVPQYNPNEEELKLDSLVAFHDNLKSKNNNVLTTSIEFNNARNAKKRDPVQTLSRFSRYSSRRKVIYQICFRSDKLSIQTSIKAYLCKSKLTNQFTKLRLSNKQPQFSI